MHTPRRRPSLPLALLWAACLLGGALPAHAQSGGVPDFPYSSMADRGCQPCYDTVQVLMIRKIFDLGFLLPEWNPVVDWGHSEAVEGIVVPVDSNYYGNHVSQEDFSGYHFTHDYGFNVRPDPRYRRVLARRIYTGHEIDLPTSDPDTLIDHSIHVEWETGLAAANKGNPCAEANRRGESCGYFSAGHKRGEVIWNWPSIGDWVHAEGTWIWDRGHPPARTELHPLRLCLTHRNALAFVPTAPGGTDSVFAGRIDIFASGDGGALQNNRPDRPAFVVPTRMSERDYAITVPLKALGKPLLLGDDRQLRAPRLFYRIETHGGDSHPAELQIDVQGDSLHIRIPWQGHSDTAVLARTIYYWWEGQDPSLFAAYEVHVRDIRFHQRKDVLSRPERVLWVDVAGQWVCLNEFLDTDDILVDGLARSYKRDWEVDLRFMVYCTPMDSFRVHVGGWENDGISRVFGYLLDPNAPCTKETKKAFHKHLWPATPFGLHGCLDDLIGEVHDIVSVAEVGTDSLITSSSFGRENELEQCPGANTEQDDVFTVRYSIRRVR